MTLYKRTIWGGILLSLVLLSLVLLSSCTNLYYRFVVSPGKIQRANLGSGIGEIRTVLNDVNPGSGDSVEIVGHCAASFRHYPMGNTAGLVFGNGWHAERDSARDVNDLMDAAFRQGEPLSMEIDAQPVPEGHILYAPDKFRFVVMHNEPTWSAVTSPGSPVAAFLLRNTVKSTLRHFIDEGYSRTGKVYLEIKSTAACYDTNFSTEACREPARLLADEVSEFILETNSPDKKSNWLAMTSFSHILLDSFRRALPPALQDEVDYVLILGTTHNGLLWKLAQAKGPVPHVTPAVLNFAATTRWLDGVWFSMRGVPGWKSSLPALIARRKNECPDCPLDLTVVHYDVSWRTFKRRLVRDPRPELPIKSVMIDVDDARH